MVVCGANSLIQEKRLASTVQGGLVLGPRSKFAVYALHRCVNVRLDHPIDVLPDVSIYPSAPVPLDAVWTKWLGTLKAEYLSEATLAIVANERSETALVGNDRDDYLNERAACFFYALCMQGVPDYSGAIRLSGGLDESGIDVRTVRDASTVWRFIHAPRVIVHEDSLRSAARIAEGVWTVDHSSGRFERLRRGLRSWVKGIHEHLQRDRLHQFVRSVEAFLRSPNAATFAERCAELCPGTDRQVFREIYELRNAVEHLNDWTDAIGHVAPDERNRHATLRSFQMEQFAGYLYRQVCAEPARLEEFADDRAIGRFIRADAAQKQAIIGGAFDMNAVGQQLRFMPRE